VLARGAQQPHGLAQRAGEVGNKIVLGKYRPPTSGMKLALLTRDDVRSSREWTGNKSHNPENCCQAIDASQIGELR